jgi:multiple sugar transport system permease protein
MATADQTRAAPFQPETLPTQPGKKYSLERRQRIWGWVFLSPWIIGFLAFTLIPIVASLIFTFTEFSLNSGDGVRFNGLDNWIRLFNDPLTLSSLGVTLKFMLIAVPFGIALPLLFAAILNSKFLAGKRFLRVLFYMPYLVPAISGIFVWQAFLNGDSGWLNRILEGLFGIDAPNWVFDENWILVGFMLIGAWGVGNAMLTMLATQQGVPTELYEAADVDGASYLTKYVRITLPMMSPVIFYNLILSVIGVMQYFVVPYVMTRGTGNPNSAAYFYNMHLYKTSFTFFDMGYGATQAWFMFIIALILTAALFATSRRWVYYASGD